MITKQELVKLAKMQDPEPELYKLTYGDILAIKDKIETVIRIEKDDRLFSILMKLKSHIMVCEDWIRYTEVRRIEELSSLDEIVSYIEKTERLGRVTVCVWNTRSNGHKF